MRVTSISLAVFAIANSTACGQENLTLRPAFLAASTELVDFGDVFLGHEESRTVYLINTGEQAITLESSSRSVGAPFAVVQTEWAVPGNSDLVIEILFTPVDVTSYETIVGFDNDSSNAPNLAVTLRGRGVSSDPCYGLTCNNPPSSACLNSSTSRHWVPAGVCANGECHYESSDEDCELWGCDFESGLCSNDPCVGVACADPPPPTCLGSSTSRSYLPIGTCTNGDCHYQERDEDCEPPGCDFETGRCLPDPCTGVACLDPPNGCFKAVGTCVNGACQYITNDNIPCDDSDPCTDGDTCIEGSCRATPRVCNSPEPPYCVGSVTLRQYQPHGVCYSSGLCQYNPTDVYCAFGCTDGECNGDPCAGGCDDGNPCTFDDCDPIAGCQHTPQAGSCVAGSGDCPTGECVGGNCLPKAGVTCEAEYDLDLCQEATIAGICTGAGECVVTDVPPQYQCPDCNGICLECYIIQICIGLF